MSDEFDSDDLIDIAVLAAHWALESGRALSITNAEAFQKVVALLRQLWGEIDADTWGGVWTYDVVAPLGEWLGDRDPTDATVDEIREFVRSRVAEQSVEADEESKE